MAVNNQGFRNHMLHKKQVWKPTAMTCNTYFYVFIFSSQKDYEKACVEMSAFNSYYNYTIEKADDILALCLINNKIELREQLTKMRKKK